MLGVLGLLLQVDVLVTTAGGVEEDLIKCLAPTYLGEFSLRGKELRENGINRWDPVWGDRGVVPGAWRLMMCASVPRIGNLLVPNDNYCKFEDWLMPILDQMVLEQNTEVGLALVVWWWWGLGNCGLMLMSPPS